MMVVSVISRISDEGAIVMARESGDHGLAESGIEQVCRRNIDGDGQHLTGSMPGSTLLNCPLKDERGQRLHEPGFLGERNEVEWRDEIRVVDAASAPMLPSLTSFR